MLLEFLLMLPELELELLYLLLVEKDLLLDDLVLLLVAGIDGL